jgi:hypothetical protein
MCASKETCWEMGFDREIDAGLYLSGEAPEIMDFYPELLYYRDIVFLFKFMMTPEVEALPEVRQQCNNSVTRV